MFVNAEEQHSLIEQKKICLRDEFIILMSSGIFLNRFSSFADQFLNIHKQSGQVIRVGCYSKITNQSTQ